MAKGRPREFDTETALDAALRLFWRQGYEGTSIAELTGAMGINVPSLYAAFGNKEALFRRTLEHYLQGPAYYLPGAMNQPTALLAVKHMFKGAIDMAMHRYHPNGCMLVQGALATGPAGEPARLMLNHTRAAAETAVRRRFERAIVEGDLPATTRPGALARLMVTIVWGLSVQAAGGATRSQLREVTALAMGSWPFGAAPPIKVSELRR